MKGKSVGGCCLVDGADGKSIISFFGHTVLFYSTNSICVNGGHCMQAVAAIQHEQELHSLYSMLCK